MDDIIPGQSTCLLISFALCLLDLIIFQRLFGPACCCRFVSFPFVIDCNRWLITHNKRMQTSGEALWQETRHRERKGTEAQTNERDDDHDATITKGERS